MTNASDPRRDDLKRLSVEELDRMIAEREEHIRPLLEEIRRLRRTRAAKTARSTRTANEASKIKSQEAQAVALREQLGGGRGFIPEMMTQMGLPERTLQRRLAGWRKKNPRRS